MVRRAFVTPGERVAEAEEFEVRGAARLHGFTYLAEAAGVAVYDERGHVAVVKPVRDSPYPPPGSVVYCQVVGKGRRAYSLRCFAREDGRNVADLKYPLSAAMPFSLIDGEVGIGDYVRARVVSSRLPLVVSARSPTMGAVLSRCPRCGTVLRRRGASLVCPRCGAEVARKVAAGYYL